MGQDLGNTNGNGYGDLMNIIKQKCREADILAARFYKLAERGEDRAARDWLNKVKICNLQENWHILTHEKCRNKLASNIAYLTFLQKNVEEK